MQLLYACNFVSLLQRHVGRLSCIAARAAISILQREALANGGRCSLAAFAALPVHGSAVPAYEGAPLLSTLDVRKPLLICAIFVARELDFDIENTDSGGNSFNYFIVC